jgi:hypothetical protein
MTTQGLWHYPATITNATIATAFLTFGTATGYPTTSTAGVINDISGRKQVRFCGTSFMYTDLSSDGVLHRLCNRLERNVELPPTYLDSLGH